MNENIKLVAKYSIKNIVNASIQDCIDYISSKKILGIDIETSRKFKRGTYPDGEKDVYKAGLDPYLSNVIMLQVGDLEQQFVIDTRDFTVEELKPIISILNWNKDIILVFHNGKFEAKHLKHNYGINFHTVYDTMIGELTLYNGLTVKLGLADLAEKYLGVKKVLAPSLFPLPKNTVVTLDEELLEEAEHFITPFEVEENAQIDKSIRMQFINIGDKPFSYDQVAYGADDIIYPILIRENQLVGRKLEDGYIHKPIVWQKIEMAYIMVLADMELAGLPIIKEKWLEIYEKNLVIFNKRKIALDTYILKHFPEYSAATIDLFSNEPNCHIKWSSNKQVVELFKKLDACPKAFSKQTKKIEFTVGAKELLKTIPNKLKVAYEKDKDVEITDVNTLKLAYLLFKKSEQATTTFGKKWLRYVHPITGRCHSNYRQILNTTRISSVSPNLNNISNGEYRGCFSVENPRTLIVSDFSAQELRGIAEISGDQSLMDFFIKGDDFWGEDFHSFAATKVYRALEENPELIVPPKEIIVDGDLVKNPDFTEEDATRRLNSKSTTFKMLYGSTPFTIASDLGLTVEEGQALYDGYMEAFPGLKDYFKKAEKNAYEKNYIVIEKTTGALWNSPFSEELKYLQDEYDSYFPPDYKYLKWSKKEDIQKQVYEDFPEAKSLMRKIGKIRGSIRNKNFNYPVQSACAQIMKIACNILRKTYIEQKLDLKILSSIYDELVIETNEEQGGEMSKIIKNCLEQGGKIIFPKVPQVVTPVISKQWEH